MDLFASYGIAAGGQLVQLPPTHRYLTVQTSPPPTLVPTLPHITGRIAGIKRSSEELLTFAPMLTNGNGITSSGQMSPGDNADLNSDAKKVRLELQSSQLTNKTSRVLHFRGIPSDATEGEVIQLGMPFGRMTNLVLAKKKNQALLEMAEVGSAQTMLNYYTERPPQIRGRTVFVQFSNHEQLKTEVAANMNSGAQVALQTAQELSFNPDEPRTVLRVIVENMLYPVTIEVLKQIFSKYGQVLKIVTFHKNNTFQALVQYSDPIAAQTARTSLNGQNVYNGCCTLRIDFSKLQSLNIKYNNDKSRDFTNPMLMSGDLSPHHHHQQQAHGAPSALHVDPTSGAVYSFPANAIGLHHGGVVAQSPYAALPAGAYGAAAPGPQGHHVITAGGMQLYCTSEALTATSSAKSPPYHTLHQPAPQPHHFLTASGFTGYPANLAMPIGLPGMSALPGFPVSPYGAAGLGLVGVQTQAVGSVLLVSNLQEERATPDALFTLFGIYGDIVRVKIMFNKKDNALIQFSDPSHAALAMVHLDKLELWGKRLKVSPSKHGIVQMPKEGQPDAGLTKDYTQSPLHRFKKPNSKNHHNIFSPSATLHLSNIPSTTSEEYIRDLFSKHGTVVAFKFFLKDHKMALLQMGSVDEAVDSLIALHNHQLAETSHLRVSFSKSPILPGRGAVMIPNEQQ